MLDEREFAADGVSIHYAIGPESGPPLLLLHGATLDWHSYLSITPGLMEHWHVVVPDLRGHGRSGRVPEGYRVIDYSRDMLRLSKR